MPAELYSKQFGEDGSESFVKVDALPEEVVKEHPEYNRVNTLYTRAVDESKKLKTRAQEAEAKLQEKPAVVETPVTPAVDEDALYQKFRDKLKAEQSAETAVKRDADLETENLIKQHRLQDIEGIRDILAQAGSGKNTLAESIGRGLKKFAPVSGGDVSLDTSDFMDGVYSRLNIPVKK